MPNYHNASCDGSNDLSSSQDAPTLLHRSRTISAQNEGTLLRALNETGLTPVGKAIGHDHTYVSRFRSGDQGMKLADLMTLLEVCGIKLITAGDDMQVIDKADYKILLGLANKGLRALNQEADK